ncbi:AlpA family phage regulatory protein [Ferrimonas aestuarii]|uniref:AlpA family phage regulatory protein n=2 Tax=Ferrimonas aestuarii TaxID=2569539 RepID=A0A4U1BLQ6_9GAMM|nr:AlpA family phage regulatory protein [Ferrimonas aestuarii]
MTDIRLMKLREVLGTTALSRSTLYRLILANRFPAPVELSGPRNVAWRSSEVSEWIESRQTAKWALCGGKQ